jgi:dephospho-CoA kinase
MKKQLIGLTGTNGSGKGEAAEFFKKKGYDYVSLSDIIREELKKDKLDITRDNLIKKGNYLRETFGPDILAKRAVDKIKNSAVIDSIRNPSEVEYLKRKKNFILLAVDAPVEIRYQRVKKRGRDESAESLEQFINKENQEKTNNITGQQLQTCLQMADYKITNEGNLEDLYRKLEVYL